MCFFLIVVLKIKQISSVIGVEISFAHFRFDFKVYVFILKKWSSFPLEVKGQSSIYVAYFYLSVHNFQVTNLDFFFYKTIVLFLQGLKDIQIIKKSNQMHCYFRCSSMKRM